MNILESFKMASATLIAHKLRSSLTITGITIGSASVILMIGIGEGAKQLATEQFKSLGPNVLFVSPGSEKARETSLNPPKTLVLADAEAIASQVPTVAAVAPQINLRELITYRNRNTKQLVLGVTPEFLEVRNYQIAKGRFITQIDIKRKISVVVLGYDLAQRLFVEKNPLGEQIQIRNLRLEVVGVLEPKGTFLGTNQDETAYLPISTLTLKLRGQNSPYGTALTYMSVSARDKNSIRAAKFQIENLLRLRHKITNEDDFTVSTQETILKTVDLVTNGLIVMLALIASISLLVGGIGVMNIMLVSVTERTQEIGLRKALGATEKDILFQFLIESILLSIAGGILGTVIGISGSLLISSLSTLSVILSPWVIVLAVGTSGAIGLFFGVVPAQKAAQLEPIVALRKS
ncbi:ABC transporter permease [Aphanothece hegewaldii CCALA 016]|uniref:ABC transporter permease n=1 Tax=Aphanothece hegewaldii CCALA 016 TaxID=2107694 RepID=A0A2T1LY98_9CHRO|nr:ABC transporter permease [Aphanothece hegewaldii]PSF37363.1 ABC transporter permease [Aphanothece hegewaldii CCALA 016]